MQAECGILSETKLSSIEMRDFTKKLDDYDGIFVDSRGHSGGLAMRWKKSLQVTLLSCSSTHVDVSIQWTPNDPQWRFTGIYGSPETQNKMKTCALLLDLKTHSALPWLIGGDLNEILYNTEKQGGPSKPQTILESFQATLATCDLYD